MITKCYVIPTQKRCNCNCDFCISKQRSYNKNQEFLIPDKKLIETILLLKERNIRKFEITGGGEPFLNNNLQEIIDLVKGIIPDCYIKLYTNGNILKPIRNIDEINISVVHYKQDINNSIMHANKSYDIITKLKYFKEQLPSSKIRLSIPLMKNGIDTKEKLDEFIKLTSFLVDEYVVRTLYPGTKDQENKYVYFEYNNPLVIIEKDLDVKNFDGLVLWSDGNIYSNWQLNNERNLNEKGYILLKPDSQTYINEIEKMILDNDFTIIKKYFLNNFSKNALLFYQDKLDDIEYFKKVKKHLENTAYLFGDVGVLMLLGKYKSYEDLVKDIYELKLKIRSNYSLTFNKKGRVQFEDGSYELNLVHAPNPNVANYQRDINLMKNNELLDSEIKDEEWQLVKKYCSYIRR